MMNYDDFVSVSVIKESFKKTCEVSDIVLHLLQKERKKREEYFYADVKINRPNTQKFHRKCFIMLEKDFRADPKHITSYNLLKFKDKSNGILIEPTIFTKEFGLIGEPDIFFEQLNSADIVEIKDRDYKERSAFDVIQAKTYMFIIGCQDSKIIKRGNNFPKSIRKQHRENVSGHILYRGGKIISVPPIDRGIIELKASEILETIKRYNSISDLPEPTRCDSGCVNFYHCEKKGNVYENTFASPGRAEIKSLAYLARA